MKLINLETKKILHDLKYWKDEVYLKKEMVQQIDNIFNEEVSKYLKQNPDVHKKWNEILEKKDKELEDIVNRAIENDDFDSINEHLNEMDDNIKDDDLSDEELTEEEIEKKKEDDNIFKRIYREIVKMTHPDKIKNLSSEEKKIRINYYVEATKYYDERNFAELLFIAFSLHITFDLDESNLYMLRDMLTEYKKQSEYIESTFTWKWYHSTDDNRQILLTKFIENEIINRKMV
jgi:hypothetical protein